MNNYQKRTTSPNRVAQFIHYSLFITNFLVFSGYAFAHGGGTPQLSRQSLGDYVVSVWTNPDPLRTNTEAHVTIAIADQNGDAALGLPLTLTAGPLARSASALTFTPTNADSENKLNYETDFTPPEAGTWQFVLRIEGVADELIFSVDIEESEETSSRNIALIIGGGIMLLLGAIGLLLNSKS